MGLLDRIRRGGRASSVGAVKRAKSKRSGKDVGSYFRGGRNINLNSWRPFFRSEQREIGLAWDAAAARTADALHNSGWLAGALEQSTANVVGLGLRLKPSPEAELLGWDKAYTRRWIKLVERRWELWANNPQECDVEGKRTFGQMQQAGYGTWLATGEILTESVYRRRPWNDCGTKFRLLSPMRLSRRSSEFEGLINGVYQDADGMPIGYAIKQSDTQLPLLEDRLVRARDAYGRQHVVHVFNGKAETSRGITPLAPVLQVVRQFDQLSDATLMASIVQTLFAATIESGEATEDTIAGLLSPKELAEMQRASKTPIEALLDAQEGYYEGSPLDVGMNGRIGHLFPGDKFNFHTAEDVNASFGEFQKVLIREIARVLGMTYEAVSLDYNGATYASLGRAGAEIHEVTKLRRNNVIAPACQPHYDAWLEEQIQTGAIPFPGGIRSFLANRNAATRAIWRGGAKPIAEELKLSKAHEGWLRMGVMSEQMVCADLGVDYEDVLQERSEAKELRGEYGLEEPIFSGLGGSSVQQGQDEEEDEDA